MGNEFSIEGVDECIQRPPNRPQDPFRPTEDYSANLSNLPNVEGNSLSCRITAYATHPRSKVTYYRIVFSLGDGARIENRINSEDLANSNDFLSGSNGFGNTNRCDTGPPQRRSSSPGNFRFLNFHYMHAS